jgi:acetyl-CoA C-acetyltransferase
MVTRNKGEQQPKVDLDEEVGKFDRDKMGSLRRAFRQNGTVTAGNASSISDGGAALAMMVDRLGQQGAL